MNLPELRQLDEDERGSLLGGVCMYEELERKLLCT